MNKNEKKEDGEILLKLTLWTVLFVGVVWGVLKIILSIMDCI